MLPTLVQCVLLKLKNMDDAIRIVREKILTMDRAMISLLAQRMELVRELGNLKKNAGLPVVDTDREKILFAEWEKVAALYELSPSYIHALWKIILEESIREQS